MSDLDHRVGVSEANLVVRHLKLVGITEDNIEAIMIEINLRKTKFMLLATYHPPSQPDDYYFDSINKALDKYACSYDKILVVGDFSA